MLEQIKCNLCGSDDFHILAKTRISPFGVESNLVRCKRCNLAYFNPRLSINDEMEFYRSVYIQKYGEEFWYYSRIRFFRYILKKLESVLNGKGKLLDVGCGMGYFLKEAQKRGWVDVVGEDVSHYAVEYARQKLGLHVLEGELSEVGLPNEHFDVVTVFNVLDQVQDPFGMLKKIFVLLRRGGVLSIRVSNLKYNLLILMFANIMGFPQKSSLIHSCFHIYAFSSKSISKALQLAGYTDIKVYNSPIEGGNFKMSLLERIFRYLAFIFVQIVYWITFGKLVIGPSLLVFARKPNIV